MDLTAFEHWLDRNRNHWQTLNDPVINRQVGENKPVRLPPIYAEFIERFGPVSLFDNRILLIGPKEIEQVTQFVRSLNVPDEDISFDHLVPFADRLVNQWYYCFDGECVVDFDPLDPFSIEHVIAPTFEEFLDYLMAKFSS